MGPNWERIARPSRERRVVITGGGLPESLDPRIDAAGRPIVAAFTSDQGWVAPDPGALRPKATDIDPATGKILKPGLPTEVWAGTTRRAETPGSFYAGQITELPLKPGRVGGYQQALGGEGELGWRELDLADDVQRRVWAATYPADPSGAGNYPTRPRGFRQGVGRVAQWARQREGSRQPIAAVDAADALLGPEFATPEDLRRYDRPAPPPEPGDPSFQASERGPRATREPAYSTIAVPYRDAGGEWRQPSAPARRGQAGSVSPLRLDPMADTGVFLRDIVDEPVYIENDRNQPESLKLGRLIGELQKKHKTPVMGRSSLEKAYRDGRFVPLPADQRQGTLIGYLDPARDPKGVGTPVYAPMEGRGEERTYKTATRDAAIPNRYGGADVAPQAEQIFRVGNPMARDMDAILSEIEFLGRESGSRVLQDLVSTVTMSPAEVIRGIQGNPRILRSKAQPEPVYVGPVDLQRMAAVGRTFSDPDPETGVMRVVNPQGGEALLVPELVRGRGGALTDIRTPRYILVENPEATFNRLGVRQAGVGQFLEPGTRQWLETKDDPDNPGQMTANRWLNADGTYGVDAQGNPRILRVWDVLEELREAAESGGPGFASRAFGELAPGDTGSTLQSSIPGLRQQLRGTIAKGNNPVNPLADQRVVRSPGGTTYAVSSAAAMPLPLPGGQRMAAIQGELPIQVQSPLARLVAQGGVDPFVAEESVVVTPGRSAWDALYEGDADDVGRVRGYAVNQATERPLAAGLDPLVEQASRYTAGDRAAAELVVESALRNARSANPADVALEINNMMARPVKVYRDGVVSGTPSRVYRAAVPAGELTAAAAQVAAPPPVAEPRQLRIAGMPELLDRAMLVARTSDPGFASEAERRAAFYERAGQRAWEEQRLAEIRRASGRDQQQLALF